MSNRRSFPHSFVALVLFATIGLTANLAAQSSLGGSVNGTVSDPTGAAVANATVQLRSNATGVAETTTTSSAGQFVFPVVLVGEYTLRVSGSGFADAVLKGVTVVPNKATTEAVTLKVGSSTESVEVTASTVNLETESAQHGTSFDNATYEDLPLALAGAPRSPTALSDLMPGVATAPTNSSSFSEPGEVQIFSQTVNGGQTLASEVYYDGVAQLQTNVAGDYRYQPVPVEAISEFTLVQNNFSAEYSRTPGGIVSLNTRSGTNSWHGEAYEYNENNAMNAAGWFQPQVPVERQNEFGVSGGGPIRKDKTFIFGYYSGFRFASTKPLSPALIPSAAEVQGDFSGLTNNNGQVKIYDPTTTTYNPGTGTYSRQQFSCNGVLNVICPNRFTSVAQQFIPYIPTNYLNNNENGQPNFLGGGVTDDNYNRWGVKIDNYMGEKDVLHAFYAESPYKVYYPTEVYKFPFTGIGFEEPDNSLIVRIAENHTFTSNLLNYFAVGYNRDNALYTSPRTFSATTLGITNIPNITPAFGLGQYGPAGWGDPGQRIIENGIAVSDFVSWVKGKHTLKIGAELRHYQDNTTPISSSQFNFSTAETNDPNNPTNTGNEFASFLIGAVDNASQQYALSEITSHFWYMGTYVQDNWKFNRKLTLNFGLRYDIPWTRAIKHNIYSSFEPNAPNPGAGNIPGALVFAGSGQYHCDCTRFSNTRFNLFQPRLGFAYQVDNSTVVRGGIGIFEGSAGDVLENGSRVFSDGFNARPSFSTPDSGVTPAFYIDNGFPSFVPPPNIDPTLDNGQSISYIQPKDGTPPRVYYWNVDVQRALPGKILLDVGYVGNNSTHISSNLENIDQLNPAYLSLGQVLTQNLTPAISAQYNVPYPWPTFTGTVAQALRPFPQYLYIGQPMQTSGWAHYHALQAKAQRQFSHGMSLLVSYTYASLLTTGESQHQYLDANGGSQNSFNYKGELSPSASLPPQVLNVAYIYSLPFGKGKKFGPQSGLGDAILGGWRVSVIQRYQSGTPFNVDVPDPQPNVLFHNEERPNIVPGVPVKNQWLGKFNPYVDTYLNPLAFSEPAPFTLGNAPRTINTRGFAWYNEDIGLAKEFRFRERYSFTLEGHAFNVLNRVTFGSLDSYGPGTNSDFGHINGQGNTPRVLQVSGVLKF
ncbi:MAG TPA: carboxypeptidase regulatory-like domain-containing protein [Candidatus Sulfotelmatobacter sp.]|nr:carboxypeptidase regulatory-like domain-containing protein [Candidatus Sulfotelmatobacter sp.]